jgi:carbon monoxide dehydrogenase subunit G
MPTARKTRLIAAPSRELWTTVSDPHHLPRWWPRVSRVEDVTEDAFTEVLRASSGRSVRADFTLLEHDVDALRLRFSQRLQGSPFARVWRSSETTIALEDGKEDSVTEVTIELRQTPSGLLPRFGSFMMRRAAEKTIEEALDGLASIGGEPQR